jgi:hypothetical protein
MAYLICDDCAVGLSNDDWTHLDWGCDCPTGEPHHDDCYAEAHWRVIQRSVAVMGCVSRVVDADEPGYFECFCCGGIQCSGGHVFARYSEVEHLEVFEVPVEAFIHAKRTRNGTWMEDLARRINPTLLGGYYHWQRQPGCVPDTDAAGPFGSEESAMRDALGF